MARPSERLARSDPGRANLPPSRPGTRAVVVLAVAATVTLVATAVVPRYLRAAALVVNAAGIEGWPHRVAAWHAARVRKEEERIPSRHGSLSARLYRPEGAPRRAVLLIPGIHAGGLDEPRLVDLASHLASRRFGVLTVELPDLRRYHITPRTTDMIEDAARWLASNHNLALDGRVGIAGISFAGGLGVVAAGRPALRRQVSFVLSVGGHGDLHRTLRYLFTGILADGTRQAPHDYGVAIALLAVANRIVPPAQVESLESGIAAFLEASNVDAVDKRLGKAAFDQVRAREREIPEPAATLLRLVNTRNVGALGAALLPHLGDLPDDPALSPELSPGPTAPVYLLHGSQDDVIPSLESRLLAEHLEGRTRVALLVTPALRHADLDRPPGLRDVARLVAFWAGALDE